MKKKNIKDFRVNGVDHLNQKIVRLRLSPIDGQMPAMTAGQFAQVRIDNEANTFLRRPISLHAVNPDSNELWLLVAMIGAGTRRLGQLNVGDKLNLVLPLGNGFTLPDRENKRCLLVGGGVGIAPLLMLGRQLREKNCEPTFLIGLRTATDLVERELYEDVGRVFITTEDGSLGERGFVTKHSILQQEHFDRIATCGPKPMMQSVARYAQKVKTICEASLENTMACGIGACLCCVENTIAGHKCVCTDGPVFNINTLADGWTL